MCMMLYIAAGQELPLVAWDEANPTFYLEELADPDHRVRVQFSKPLLYQAGSHQGCGCGFQYGIYEYGEEEERAGRESVRRLAEYLAEAVQTVGTLEMYACWDGYQAEAPEVRGVVTLEEIPTEFGGDTFIFEDREFIEIRKQP